MSDKDALEATIGSYAPDFSLPASTGATVRLSDFRGKAAVVLFFVRESNCRSCRTHTIQLGRFYPTFHEAGAEIIVILGGTPEEAREYARRTGVPFPVLSDPQRQVYKQYQLEKYLLLIQRTASVVVDRGGTIRYLKRTTLPNVWPQESRELLGFVDSLNDAAR